jgi:hypothetical protein
MFATLYYATLSSQHAPLLVVRTANPHPSVEYLRVASEIGKLTAPLPRHASDSAKRFLVERTEANNSAPAAVTDSSDHASGTSLLDRHVELELSRSRQPYCAAPAMVRKAGTSSAASNRFGEPVLSSTQPFTMEVTTSPGMNPRARSTSLASTSD